jgi:nucleotide-binding universal stress UspA family protein
MPVMERAQSRGVAISFNRILIATDLSDASKGAEKWGVAFARYYHSEAYLVHAILPKSFGFATTGRLPSQNELSWDAAEQRMQVLAADLKSKGILPHIWMQRQPAVDLIS